MKSKTLITVAMAMITSTPLAFAAGSTKKASKKPEVTLTEREKKIVADAQKTFKQAEKLPPPSKHMQDKMDSAFHDVPAPGEKPAEGNKKTK